MELLLSNVGTTFGQWELLSADISAEGTNNIGQDNNEIRKNILTSNMNYPVVSDTHNL